MKTTIELPDELLLEAKSVAARRRTTLKAMMEHALRREINGTQTPPPDAPYSFNKYGFPVARPSDVAPMTEAQIRQCAEQAEANDDSRALQAATLQ